MKPCRGGRAGGEGEPLPDGKIQLQGQIVNPPLFTGTPCFHRTLQIPSLYTALSPRPLQLSLTETKAMESSTLTNVF